MVRLDRYKRGNIDKENIHVGYAEDFHLLKHK